MNILITAPMRKKDLEELQLIFEEVTYKPWTLIGTGYDAETTLRMLNEAKADAFISELDDVNEYVINSYPNLKFIGDCRANPANIDLKAASAHKIPVICTPARNAEAVAELLVGTLICFMRNVQAALKWVADGAWVEGTTPYYLFMGHEIQGKKIGFVGFGAVGRATARILRSFGAEICYYDPYVNSTPENDAKKELNEIFAECDIVSIHLPVLPSTRGMITKELLASMKPDGIFVNTSRSAVVDSNALLEILKEKKIAGAVIDVYDHEPPAESDLELMRLENVLATPHICGSTYEVTDHQSEIVLQGIKKWLKKEDVERVVFNKDIL